MKKKPIFGKILIPVTGLILLVVALFVSVIVGLGLMGELKNNEIAVVDEKIVSRGETIENQMVHDWMMVGMSVDNVNELTQTFLDEEGKSMDEVQNSNTMMVELLKRLTPEVLEMVQSNHATGAYLVLNTEDLEPAMETGQFKNKQGIYIRRNDPNSRATDLRSNVLMLRSPIAVVQDLKIPMDSKWNVIFEFGDDNIPYYDFLYRPFQMAYHHRDIYTWRDMGCWSKPYQLDSGTQDALTYSVPLILDDGTLYGVMGIDITAQYMQSLLPSDGLSAGGTYFLALKNREKNTYTGIFGEQNRNWILGRDGDNVLLDRENYYFHDVPLYIYESNAPFAGDEWVIAGAVPYSSLYSFVRRFNIGLSMAVILTLIVGVVGSFLLSYTLQLPIARLAQELRSKDPMDEVRLQATGIAEIDEMASEMEHISRTIAYERDHDALTDLLNRRAFRRIIDRMFEEHREELQVAAYLMFDLDNLKHVNDSYGHEYGDRYIKQMAEALREGVSGKCYYARISGDEFNVFLYGSPDREEMEKRINLIREAIPKRWVKLPDGKKQMLHASGGVAWYPDDSTSATELAKFADFAMYSIKRTTKDQIGNFDRDVYDKEVIEKD